MKSEEQHEQRPVENLNGCCALALTFPKREEKPEQRGDESIHGVCCE